MCSKRINVKFSTESSYLHENPCARIIFTLKILLYRLRSTSSRTVRTRIGEWYDLLTVWIKGVYSYRKRFVLNVLSLRKNRRVISITFVCQRCSFFLFFFMRLRQNYQLFVVCTKTMMDVLLSMRTSMQYFFHTRIGQLQ